MDHYERTVFGKAAAVMCVALPMLAMIGYGVVDVWSLIPLSLFTGLLAVFWTADGLRSGFLNFSTSPLQLPIVGLILIGCLQLLPLGGAGDASAVLRSPASASLTLDPFATRIFTVRLFLLLIYFAAVLTFVNGKRLAERVALAVIVFGGVMAFAGILQRLASPDAIYGMRPTPQAIPFGPFVNQHHFAAFMEMTIGLTLAVLFGGAVRRDRKALYLIAAALMLIAVVMTGSRGGVIATFCTAGFVFAASYALGRRHAGEHESGRIRAFGLAAAAAGVLLTAAVGVLFLSGADPLVRGIGLQGGQADVTSGRTHFWGVAWRIFLENPIIGAGYDAFGVAFTRFDTWNGFFRVENAHNDYLQILADGGVAAFACVAAFVFLFFRRAMGVIRNSTSPGRRAIAVGALAGCFGILVHSFFDFPLRTYSNAYFFLLLTALATVPLGDEREPAS